MKGNRIIWILGSIVVVLLILAIVGKKLGWVGGSDAQKVAVEKVSRRSLVETVTASGKINPQTEVKLSSEVSGEVIELNANEGDSVKKGQLLCVVNPSIYEAVVTQTEAGLNQVKANLSAAKASAIQAKVALDQAQRTYDRQQKLHNDKVIADAEFEAAKLQLDQAQANYETATEQVKGGEFSVASAEAQLKQAQDNLNKTKIYAPISGIVSLVNVKLHERVVGTAQMAGTEIIRIADLEHMQAEVDVNENDVLRVALGDTAEIEVDAYVKKKFLGVVTQISYSATNTTSQVISTSQATNFTVSMSMLRESYADLIKPELGRRFPFRPGMSATVDIKTASRNNVLTVPTKAVTTRDAKDVKANDAEYAKTTAGQKAGASEKRNIKEIVFVVVGGKAVAREVTTGIQDASYMEIISGVKEGETVIDAPYKLVSKTLKDGDDVKVVDEKDLFTGDSKAE